MSDFEKTYVFYASGLNSDDDLRYVREGDGIDGRLNITTSQDGNQGLVKTINGNELIFKALPYGTNNCIGTIENTENKSIIYFVYNSGGSHRVFEYYPFEDDRIDLILKSEAGANFNWTSTTQISGVCLDNICYFNDPVPRVINLNAALISNTSIIYEVETKSEVGSEGDGIYLLNGVYYRVLDSAAGDLNLGVVPDDEEALIEYITDYLGVNLVDAYGELITK